MDFDGADFVVDGNFLDVKPTRLLRYTFGSPDQIVTVSFTRDGDGTLLTLEHAGLPDDEQTMLVDTGWSDCLDALPHNLRQRKQ